MYATARYSIPPLLLEAKVKLEYRCDGSSTFFCQDVRRQPSNLPVVFNTFDDFYKQFIFPLDYGHHGFGCV